MPAHDASPDLPIVTRFRQLCADGPIVVAHRGHSLRFPATTLPAFAAAVQMGTPMLEFDVHTTADGELVCLHDEILDRTTDAARVLGPGALVTQLSLVEVQRLDAGSWFGQQHRGARVPTLAEGLHTMLPRTMPMLEHKSGTPRQYVDSLRQLDVVGEVLLQSFDWEFVAAARALEPRLAIGVLGPGPHAGQVDAATVARALGLGASFLHWAADRLRCEAVDLLHARGLLAVTYTTDDDMACCGGARMGIDAMCTNDPPRMLELRRQGRLGRPRAGA
jgi:glycerophosphoryl diester phosphodiesterase